MALANIAARLASRGLRVVMVDWDLEAPGLHQFFPLTKRNERGLLELLEVHQDFLPSAIREVSCDFI
jgi:Mrp family chromosome partitioning ATPase